MSSNFPLNKSQLDNLINDFPTPFYLYDEAAIRENMRKFTKAFSIFPVFREHFAVKACPNPYILKILAEEGCGADCSSLPELMLSEMAGIKGKKVIFTSNETPADEYQFAYDRGNIINFDDIISIKHDNIKRKTIIKTKNNLYEINATLSSITKNLDNRFIKDKDGSFINVKNKKTLIG